MLRDMRLLVLGGTIFLGRAVVDAALARGHDVAILHRGRHPAHRPGDVEELLADRDGGLDVLGGRTFDAVVDSCGYVPRVVADSAERLAGAHHTFVSSISVYRDARPGLHEDRAVHAPPPPDVEDVTPETYGPLKVGCERVLPAGALAVRAGLIVGPHDGTNRFAYWVTRMADGGDVLVPDDLDAPVQCVDVRDLGAFLVLAGERRLSGVVNVAGARGQTLGGLLEVCRQVAGSDARLVPVPEAFLAEHGVEPWDGLPLWIPAALGLGGMLDSDDTRASALGATFRPLPDTVADVLAWARSAPPATGLDVGIGVPAAGITREREAAVLAAWRSRGTAVGH